MERGAASDAGRAPRCDKEDGLPRRGTGSGWNPRPGLGGVNDYLGSPSVTPVHQMLEGGCLTPNMAYGKTGPAEERGTPVGLAVRVQTGVPSGRGRQAVREDNRHPPGGSHVRASAWMARQPVQLPPRSLDGGRG